MNRTTFASGDSNTCPKTLDMNTTQLSLDQNTVDLKKTNVPEPQLERKGIESNTINSVDQEILLKKRIDECKNILENLKLELSEEKSKLNVETQSSLIKQKPALDYCRSENESHAETAMELNQIANICSTSLDSKSHYDENLIEYEKQLQKYQDTLNLAQTEKKNAIRKRMLAKACKLKLLEVENQCNVELLRIKQSLQCLEPLKNIAEKWKTSNQEQKYDFNSFELIPHYPEINLNVDSDVSSNLAYNDNITG